MLAICALLTCHGTVWRILVGLSLIPAFGTLYQRLTLPESTRYMESRKNAAVKDEEAIDELKKKANADPGVVEKTASSSSDSASQTDAAAAERDAHAKHLASVKKTHFKDFFVYFSEWRHLKVLLGTCSCWFLLDIA